MIRPRLFRIVFAALVLSFPAGCGGGKSLLPVYPDASLPAESAMQPYTAGDASFALPPGWVFKGQDTAREVAMGGKANKEVVGTLKREAGGSLVLSCWGTFISKQAQPKISRAIVTDIMANAVRVKAFQVVTPGSQAPQLEIYSGTMISEGQEVKINGYAAWKWNYGFGCKYGLSGFAPPSAGEQFEREVAAILRSLK